MNRTPVVVLPPLDEIVALGRSDYERAFLRREFGPGLQYYTDRLDRLMLTGGSLLDAGCGAGQWTLAAAQRFDRVEALDLDQPRMDVLKALCRTTGATNISVTRGSIEKLPYRNGSFDAVFCYGVIMFTNIRYTLSEFQRVLKPGGRLYVCLNADGWSRYLIESRADTDPRAVDAGRQTLYNTYWRRALAEGVEEQLTRTARQLRSLLPRWIARLLFGPNYRVALSPRRVRIARAMGRRCLLGSTVGEKLLTDVAAGCGPALVDTLLDDAWAIGNQLSRPTRAIPSEAFQPDEVRLLVESAGFCDFQWSGESGLACNWLASGVKPKYDAYHHLSLSVWEMLASKPEPAPPASPDPVRHIDAGRVARDERLYPEPTQRTVLSNGTWGAYPFELFDHAQRVGLRLGGSRYLPLLVRTLIDGASTDEERVRRLIVFVQQSIFRDPVSQPVTRQGLMPDSLTVVLCARGRCGHTSLLLVDLFRHAGLESRICQLTNHVVAEVRVGGRWVIADADAFKNGVIPVNRDGHLLSMDDVRADPYQLDRFQPTGWWIRKGSRFARGVGGSVLSGYVDALDPHERGFVSGYYVPAARGAPPGIPEVTRFEVHGGRLVLEWEPSASGSVPIGYRVAIGSSSRGWSYEHPGDANEIVRPPATDVLSTETPDTTIECSLPRQPGRVFASVTAVSDRVKQEAETYFWPSDEVSCEP